MDLSSSAFGLSQYLDLPQSVGLACSHVNEMGNGETSGDNFVRG